MSFLIINSVLNLLQIWDFDLGHLRSPHSEQDDFSEDFGIQNYRELMMREASLPKVYQMSCNNMADEDTAFFNVCQNIR